jgi:phosphate transport system ATP-binding protein
MVTSRETVEETRERLIQLDLVARPPEVSPEEGRQDAGIACDVRNLDAWYGSFQALRGITMAVPRERITAIIGPSGCGKSTLIRCLNRMNDLVSSFRAEGDVLFEGVNLYGRGVDAVDLRRRVGMVFQKPNPFPKSIYDNVAFGARINGYTGKLDEIVERALRQAALWDDVKDKLHKSALALSGGQQQRLCIARTVAVEPEVILMDEPCSALDPVATLRIEELMRDLARTFAIIIVTHNMQQAARVADNTAVMMMADDRAGELVEYGDTRAIFTNPQDKRTEDYITGRFG